MSKQTTTYLKKHGEYWYYQRRVPKHVAHLDTRGLVRKSTRTRYRDKALIVATEINRQTELYWEALSEGRAQEGAVSYEEAIRKARILGINYKTVHELADGKLDDILSQKTPLQIKKWKNPRLKALRNLIKVVGDKNLHEITRHDALQFRNWWMDRVQAENMDIGSANKDIGAINQMINEINDKYLLGLEQPFARMRLRGEKHNPRPPLPPEWVKSRILSTDAMSELNDVCRTVVVLMAYTGMRPSEITGLTDEDMLLEHKVPHIKIRAGNRSLKTGHSERDIPLTSAPLTAVRQQQKKGGFLEYNGRSDSLSANVNKYLRTAKLLPSEEHTLYSLRHTFQDLLIEIECPERIQAELMGHKFSRPKYGKGPGLEQKLQWLERVANTYD